MPLDVYLRGKIWWVKGRIEYDGLPITGYYRQSTGALTEQGAIQWAQAETDQRRRRYLLGEDAERVTFEMAILEYEAKPADAGYLHKILKERPDIGKMEVVSITGKFLKNLGLELYPMAATDTIWRQVVTPMRSVVNNMHELGKCPYLKVKAFTSKERVDQDTRRGKQSRIKRDASDKAWISAFCTHADPYNAALVKFMFETATRIDQAISLEPQDLDLQKKKVRIKAQKGHPEQWVEISHSMMIELANLPAKRPHNRKLDYKMEPRVFGYGSKGGYRKAWKSICKRAGIRYMSAHSAGRHGFGTELMVRQGVDPVTVAENGRWASVQMLFENYAHAEENEADIRERFRTNHVHRVESNQSNDMKMKGNFGHG